MANKALAKRQKLHYRVEPSQKALKPRNPAALAAGAHGKSGSAQRRLLDRLLHKNLAEPDEKD